MDGEFVASVSGLLISLAFSTIPFLKSNMDKLDFLYGEEEAKRIKQLMFFLIGVLVIFSYYGFACANLLPNTETSCANVSLKDVLWSFAIYVAVNYSTFGSTKFIFKSEDDKRNPSL